MKLSIMSKNAFDTTKYIYFTLVDLKFYFPDYLYSWRSFWKDNIRESYTCDINRKIKDDIFIAHVAHYNTWARIRVGRVARRRGAQQIETPCCLCARIKQLSWRKAFSLSGLATPLAQSQMILSSSACRAALSCLGPLILNVCLMEINIFSIRECTFRSAARFTLPGFLHVDEFMTTILNLFEDNVKTSCCL